MAQNTTITLTAQTWTLLTDSDISAVTFQNDSRSAVYIKATTDTSAPTTTDGAILYAGGQGERNVSMEDLFPGLSGADRLWAYAPSGGRMMISHA